MIKNIKEVKEQLRELAEVINSFKSEAVQLKIIELMFKGTKEGPPGDGKDLGEKPGDEGAKTRRGKRSSRAKPASTEKSQVRQKPSGRPGGKATLARLYDDGFFKKPKTIKQLVEHCKLNLALTYQQSDFSGALARYVRSEKLKRTKNADKQYEYTQA